MNQNINYPTTPRIQKLHPEAAREVITLCTLSFIWAVALAGISGFFGALNGQDWQSADLWLFILPAGILFSYWADWVNYGLGKLDAALWMGGIIVAIIVGVVFSLPSFLVNVLFVAWILTLATIRVWKEASSKIRQGFVTLFGFSVLLLVVGGIFTSIGVITIPSWLIFIPPVVVSSAGILLGCCFSVVATFRALFQASVGTPDDLQAKCMVIFQEKE